jgi:hypothetical protein
MAWWERINRSASAITILQAFGVWEWLMALAVGVVEFTIAEHSAADVPGWILFPAILFSMTCVLWMNNAIAEARARRRAERPDYERYRGRATFTTWEAAALWADQPINTPRLSEFGYEMFTELKRAIDTGVIQGASNIGPAGAANRATLIPVEQLRLHATRRGERPRFLYGD